MTRERTYLDWNASAPLRPEARSAMLAALDLGGNPSSVHAEGRRARSIIECARERVAALVKAKPSEVVFTSGATEANNWALARRVDTAFVCGIEHDSVLAPLAASDARIVEVPVSRDGVVRIDWIAEHMRESAGTPGRMLVTLQMANNETGVIQPVAETAALVREHGAGLHTDAVQAAGRIALDFRALGVDTMSLSSHKIGGPNGIGALVIRDGLDLPVLIRGGGQERRRRAGTENAAGIAGFGAAAEAAARDLESVGRVRALRDRLEDGVVRLTPEIVVIGRVADRLANTACLAWPGHNAETIVIKLDLAGLAVSAGSACSSGKVGASRVLTAMGLGADIARSAIRVSLGSATTEADIEAFLQGWKDMTMKGALAA